MLADGNVLSKRYIFTPETNDGIEKIKKWFVMGVHHEKIRHLIMHQSQNIRPCSIPIILALKAIHSFTSWAIEVWQAYLQSVRTISRPVFIKNPVPEFRFESNEAFQLLKPLYWLIDSEDLWFERLDRHRRSELQMEPLCCNTTLYVWRKSKKLAELFGAYVDDTIEAGRSVTCSTSKKTNDRFEMDEDRIILCTFK